MIGKMSKDVRMVIHKSSMVLLSPTCIFWIPSLHILLMYMCGISLAAIIGYAPVLYTVNESDPTGVVDVTIRLLQGDLSGLTASTAIPVDVLAASFTATGLCLTNTYQCMLHFMNAPREVCL